MGFPAFFEHAPVVRVRDPLAELLGAADDGIIEYRYADAVRLAGHSCPTVAGAFLMARAALLALFPDELPQRGSVAVRIPAPEDSGTTGVVAQVLTLLTGAAAENGFKGLGGRFARNGLLEFAAVESGSAITFQRTDTGASVSVDLDFASVPPDPAQRALLTAILQDRADADQRKAFGAAWQDRVRRLLTEHANDAQVIRVRRHHADNSTGNN
ncbi:MAG: hypothetical protein ABI304_00595 [Rudaea sp.]